MRSIKEFILRYSPDIVFIQYNDNTDYLFSIIPIKGSTKGIKRLNSNERNLIKLSSDLKDMMIGLLLGDGHIVRRSSTGNCRFVYAQSSTVHKEYFYFVYNSFFPLYFTKDYKPQVRNSLDKRNNTMYHVLTFTTMQLPCFNVYKDLFYLNRTKLVPHNIYDLLTAKGLAF